MVLGMALALLGAGGARLPASFDLSLRDGRVVLGLARENASSRIADVAAVEVQTNALAELGRILLGQAGVRAGFTCLCALDACFYAFCESSRST